MAKTGGRIELPGNILDRWGLRGAYDDDLMNLQLATTIYHEVRHLDYVGPERLLHTARGAI
eukprot:1175894-Pyramimonas_sp.AAC.1